MALTMEKAVVQVKRLAPALENDFYTLFAQPPFDWCCCAAWAVPTWEGWGERSAGANRAVREQRFREGRHDGYLLYVNSKPVGWCQCGPLTWLPKLADAMGCEVADASHAISCFAVLPEMRGRGLAHALVEAVLADLAARGVKRVLAFPRRGRHDDGEVWTGPEAVFERAGFRVIDERGGRAVMLKEPCLLAR
jgi:GNAT superfamily N-acetyltransferase